MNVCPIHNLAWKLVPAGISRTTGKQYGAFWTCQVKGCPQRPDASFVPPQPAPAPIGQAVAPQGPSSQQELTASVNLLTEAVNNLTSAVLAMKVPF